ncbi:hypothetical protein PGT21_035517 [Puccinia graminis f. sp. tritici]|uniref:Uncharacterized protein n=1 Tax=Puccinia graminis f. sp. tritici TaxID=56615 RepID=A0A5B0Q971_PUCGR|nr:hypothetical protein PGTUg99_020138 [Puccinia graminis f. sp. tritici]KAA1119859.1 hypothetical protein PGT21_035517 [Puccinia graminis f. sp. tritici]
MPDLPKPIPNPEPVRGLTGFFRICGVRVGTLCTPMPPPLQKGRAIPPARL